MAQRKSWDDSCDECNTRSQLGSPSEIVNPDVLDMPPNSSRQGCCRKARPAGYPGSWQAHLRYLVFAVAAQFWLCPPPNGPASKSAAVRREGWGGHLQRASPGASSSGAQDAAAAASATVVASLMRRSVPNDMSSRRACGLFCRESRSLRRRGVMERKHQSLRKRLQQRRCCWSGGHGQRSAASNKHHTSPGQDLQLILKVPPGHERRILTDPPHLHLRPPGTGSATRAGYPSPARYLLRGPSCAHCARR